MTSVQLWSHCLTLARSVVIGTGVPGPSGRWTGSPGGRGARRRGGSRAPGRRSGGRRRGSGPATARREAAPRVRAAARRCDVPNVNRPSSVFKTTNSPSRNRPPDRRPARPGWCGVQRPVPWSACSEDIPARSRDNSGVPWPTGRAAWSPVPAMERMPGRPLGRNAAGGRAWPRISTARLRTHRPLERGGSRSSGNRCRDSPRWSGVFVRRLPDRLDRPARGFVVV